MNLNDLLRGKNIDPERVVVMRHRPHSGCLQSRPPAKIDWRQILNEADRIPQKHLLTLQEGISPNQYAEMKAAQVRLVVPRPLHDKYARELRGELVTLKEFIRSTRETTASKKPPRKLG